jgi:hypothetical protein
MADDLTSAQLQPRLNALYRDLGQFPAGVSCPWPLARVFNELLKHTKREAADDPVVTAIAAVRADEEDPEVSTALIGSVRALAGQMQVALNGGSADPE